MKLKEGLEFLGVIFICVCFYYIVPTTIGKALIKTYFWSFGCVVQTVFINVGNAFVCYIATDGPCTTDSIDWIFCNAASVSFQKMIKGDFVF